MGVKIKRIYDEPERSDGIRILIDRLWPRGVRKEEAAIDEWMREIAPSDKLRGWFGHKPERWAEFRKRYKMELAEPEKKKLLITLKRISGISTVTLLYSAKDDKHNNAVALHGILSASSSKK
jgi:uncharacterized protein YeaO (DUF488 family)